MSQTDRHPAQPTTTLADSGGERSAGSAGPTDSLASLHKMSTTAGLGSTEYVEVNPTAIAALALGLISAVVLFNQPLLLLIPAAGIVTAIFAFWQIGKSNGTQTGRLLAVAAIGLSLLFGGITGARTLGERRESARNKAAMGALVIEFRDKLRAGDHSGMYQMFDKRFQQRVPAEQFSDMMKFISTQELYGQIRSVILPGMPSDARKDYRWNGLAEFMRDDASGATLATAQLVFDFEKVGQNRQVVWFRKEGDKWVFEDIPGIFPRPPKPGEAGGPGEPRGPGGPGM